MFCRNVADMINFDWGRIRKSLKDKAVFELDFEETEFGWTKNREEHPPWESSLGPLNECGLGEAGLRYGQ